MCFFEWDFCLCYSQAALSSLFWLWTYCGFIWGTFCLFLVFLQSSYAWIYGYIFVFEWLDIHQLRSSLLKPFVQMWIILAFWRLFATSINWIWSSCLTAQGKIVILENPLHFLHSCLEAARTFISYVQYTILYFALLLTLFVKVA